MNRISLILLALICAIATATADDKPAKKPAPADTGKIVLKGDWGTLECTRIVKTIYLPGNKPKSSLQEMGIDPRTLPNNDITQQLSEIPKTYRAVCEFVVRSPNGEKLEPLDTNLNYSINGKIQQVRFKSSKPGMILMASPDRQRDGLTPWGSARIITPGKAMISVSFAGQSGEFPIEIVKSKVHTGMTSVQLIKVMGKPTLRIRKYVSTGIVIPMNGAAFRGASELHIWRWSEFPDLRVTVSAGIDGHTVSFVDSLPFPTDDDLDEFHERSALIEDNRPPKAANTPKP